MGEQSAADVRVIACNYLSATGVCSEGALAYLWLTNPGGGNDRILILARSRGGRWVKKWENIKRLGNFRLKTIPPEHPRYADFTEFGMHWHESQEQVDWLTECAKRERGETEEAER